MGVTVPAVKLSGCRLLPAASVPDDSGASYVASNIIRLQLRDTVEKCCSVKVFEGRESKNVAFSDSMLQTASGPALKPSIHFELAKSTVIDLTVVNTREEVRHTLRPVLSYTAKYLKDFPASKRAYGGDEVPETNRRRVATPQ